MIEIRIDEPDKVIIESVYGKEGINHVYLFPNDLKRFIEDLMDTANYSGESIRLYETISNNLKQFVSQW